MLIQVIKVFTIEELQQSEFCDKDLAYILSDGVLSKLLIIAMFRFMKINTPSDDIMELIKQDNWYERHKWTWHKHDMFIKEAAKVYKNIYQYSNDTSIRLAEQFVFMFGFSVKDNKKNEEKHFNRILKLNI